MKAAFLAFDECAMWQVSLLQMFLRRAGWEIHTLTVEGKNVVTDGGVVIKATDPIHNRKPEQYKLIIIAGGKMTRELAENEEIRQFLVRSTGIVAASCASSVLVASAQLIKGHFTSMPHIVEQFADYYSEGTFDNTDVCVDGTVITSKGHAHYEFMVAVLEKVGITTADPKIKQLALKLSRNQ